MVSNMASSTSLVTEKLVKHYQIIPVVVQALEKLIPLHRPDQESASYLKSVESCIWALGNTAGESSDFRDLVIATSAPTMLYEIIQYFKSTQVLRVAFWALSNFVRGGGIPLHVRMTLKLCLMSPGETKRKNPKKRNQKIQSPRYRIGPVLT